jgi:hypothetical protein
MMSCEPEIKWEDHLATMKSLFLVSYTVSSSSTYSGEDFNLYLIAADLPKRKKNHSTDATHILCLKVSATHSAALEGPC